MKTSKRRMSKRKFFYSVVIALVGIPLFIINLLLVYRTANQMIIGNRTRITQQNGIESLEKLTLGGVEQWILIRAQDQSNPVLLWLHGGPGSPTMPLASQHDQELIKHFVVVHWDQRGAGKSYSPEIPPGTMDVDQFVADTYELTLMLANRFDVPKIYLIGHSWGSQIGILTHARHPDMYFAFIGLGQFVHAAEADSVAYQFAFDQALRTNNQKAIKELNTIGTPPWTTGEQRSINAGWINVFGGTGRQYTMQNYFYEIMLSPDYTLQNLFGFIRGMSFSGNAFLANGDLNRINLFEQVPKVAVPVYFLQGRYDYNTPGDIAERYYELLDAPQKSLIWFEESAHFPHWEEPNKFMDEMLKILAETK